MGLKVQRPVILYREHVPACVCVCVYEGQGEGLRLLGSTNTGMQVQHTHNLAFLCVCRL